MSLKALLSLENTITSGDEPAPGIRTVKNPHDEIFRMAKIPYGQNSLRRTFCAVKIPCDENS